MEHYSVQNCKRKCKLKYKHISTRNFENASVAQTPFNLFEASMISNSCIGVALMENFGDVYSVSVSPLFFLVTVSVLVP